MRFCFPVIFLWFTFLYYPLPAQNVVGLPLIYSKADFNGGSHTWDIKQGNSGIMYFANTAGLLTFDGSFWKLFPLPNRTQVRSIFIASDHKVYVGGQGELGYFSAAENGQLHFTSIKDKIPEIYARFADIWDIAAAGQSVFFRATNCIFEFNGSTILAHPALSEWQYLGFAGNRLFAQDKKNGLLEYKNKIWEQIPNSAISLLNMPIASILPLRNGQLFIGAINNESFTLYKDLLQKNATVTNYFFTPSYAKINDSLLVVATGKIGCAIIDVKHQVIQKISTVEGISSNNVNSVFIDKDRNIWAGIDNGICFINYNSPIKYLRPNKINDVEGFSTRIFNNDLYISTSNGVYTASINNNNGDLSVFKEDFSLITNSDRGEARMLEILNQQLLLAHNDGVFAIRNKKAVAVAMSGGTWNFLPTSSVFPNRILAGTYNGLDLYTYNEGQFHRQGKLRGSMDSYRFIAYDRNYIWASHPYRGIYQMRMADDYKSYTTRLLTQKNGLPSDINNYVFKIKNQIVFATTRGVYEFNEETQKFAPSKSLSPIFKNIEVNYMTDDPDGNIWFTSGEKIGVVDFSKPSGDQPYSIIYFSELTGKFLRVFENIYPYNSKNIFIGSEKGTIHLNYENYTINKKQLTLFLSEVRATDQQDSIIFGGFLTNNRTVPKLPSSYKSYHFEYSSPSYGLQNNIEYSYRLEGYDASWSSWSNKTEKNYTNLPNGNYSFKVKARDNLGNEAAVTAYDFIIMPPWYKTVWAWITYILAFVVLIYTLYKWLKTKWLRQKQKFEAEQKRLKYIYELELEKNEKEIIKLQNERLEQEVVLKKKELANTSLHLAGNADTLIKIKDEINKLISNVDSDGDITRIASLVKTAERNNATWDQFATHFDELNDGFLKKLRQLYPELSKAELRVCAYLRLNLSSKEMAQQLNISVRGVEIHRYRIRKKLRLHAGQSLSDFLNNLNNNSTN